MTTRSWIGGSNNNNIYSAPNWSPAGVPGSGDTPYMESGVATMNGGALAGDTLTIGARSSSNGPESATVNLSGGATLSALISNAVPAQEQVTFNVSGIAVLHLQERENTPRAPRSPKTSPRTRSWWATSSVRHALRTSR